MTTVLQENLTGIRVVRAFARQDFECEKFAVKNAAFRDRTDRLIRFLGAYWATSDFLCVAQLFLLLLVGAWWMADGRLSVGTLFAFQLLVNFVLWPVRHLGRVLTDTGKAMVSLRRIREILDVPEEFAPPRGVRGSRAPRGSHRGSRPHVRIRCSASRSVWHLFLATSRRHARPRGAAGVGKVRTCSAPAPSLRLRTRFDPIRRSRAQHALS